MEKIQNSENLQSATIAVAAKYEGGYTNLISFNADKKIHPGSNLKLFTAAASLHYLFPEFTYSTKIYRKKNENKKIDLVIVGSGDPSMRYRDMDNFIQSIKKTGKITGDMYYDETVFTGEQFGPNWPEEWKEEYYAVPISGLQISDNLLEIKGHNRLEDDVFEIVSSPLENVKIIDKLTYKTYPEDIEKSIKATIDDSGVVTLTGDTIKKLPFNVFVPVKKPGEYTTAILKQELLKQNLIEKNAKIIALKAPFDSSIAELTHEHISPPLKDLVYAMLKFSKNNYAETLVRTLGKEKGVAGTQEEGVKILRGLFLGIEAFDGSGISSSTRVTSNDMMFLFEFVNLQDWKNTFWEALPRSQVDGTLKSRFKGLELQHSIIGKTGTHEASSSLSGKILQDGKPILFSIHIYNHPYTLQESTTKIWPLIDKIIALLDSQF